MISLLSSTSEAPMSPGPPVAPSTMPTSYHTPVLLPECVELLQPAAGKLFVDATLGGGGHAEAFLQAGATVIGIDQDPEAIDFASRRLEPFGARFRTLRCNFAEAGEAFDLMGVGAVDGVLLDLGVSSHQLDEAARGFSFMRAAPLDMRMNPEGPLTAADLVNTMAAGQLERIFKQYGEEPAARRIAARLVRERAVRPFRTTDQLAEVIEAVSPRRGKAHPATRVFQALRMAVNRELEVLPPALEAFAARLAPGGRLGVIAFHSLEDRLVKQYFATRSAATVDDPSWPAARPNPQRLFQKITGKAVVAGANEQQSNPRSRSARLRVVAKLPAASLPTP